MPRGKYFGQKDSLSTLLKGINKGYCGKKKGKEGDQWVSTGGYHKSLTSDQSNCVYHQQYGRTESFLSGRDLTNPTKAKPRWFKFGEPVTDVGTQLKIVDKLLGEANSLEKDVAERRQKSFMSLL